MVSHLTQKRQMAVVKLQFRKLDDKKIGMTDTYQVVKDPSPLRVTRHFVLEVSRTLLTKAKARPQRRRFGLRMQSACHFYRRRARKSSATFIPRGWHEHAYTQLLAID